MQIWTRFMLTVLQRGWIDFSTADLVYTEWLSEDKPQPMQSMPPQN